MPITHERLAEPKTEVWHLAGYARPMSTGAGA